MRHALLFGLGIAAVAGLAGCQKKDAATGAAGQTGASSPPAIASAPVGPPHRKAGLWAQTMDGEGGHQTIRMCLDADTDSKMSVWGQAMKSDSACAKNIVKPMAGGWAFESECDMGQGGKILSQGMVDGDFNSKYTVKVTSTTTGAAFAQANGRHEMTLTAEYQGACPAGMKGGDVNIEVPGMKGGMTMNLEKMQAMANAHQPPAK